MAIERRLSSYTSVRQGMELVAETVIPPFTGVPEHAQGDVAYAISELMRGHLKALGCTEIHTFYKASWIPVAGEIDQLAPHVGTGTGWGC